jgi:hypothetical protein
MGPMSNHFLKWLYQSKVSRATRCTIRLLPNETPCSLEILDASNIPPC